MREAIENMRNLVKNNSWTFPYYAQLMKKAQIKKYEVDMNNYNITYYHKDGTTYTESNNSSGIIGGKFDSDLCGRAAQYYQNGLKNPNEWLSQCRLAGATKVEVNFETMQVTYTGNGGSYSESIPSVTI